MVSTSARAIHGAAALALLSLLVAARPAATPSAAYPKATAIFAGGCYWGVESVYRHVKGVKSATSGLALGQGEPAPPAGSPDHDEIAEAVRLEYDSTQVSYEQLLQIFFSVVHDPTQVGRQGPDVGHRYRSALYTLNDGQKAAAEAYLARVRDGKLFAKPVTTVVYPLRKFIVMPDDQQNYAERHPSEPYIQINDVPRVAALKTQFAGLFRER